jgi:phage gp29-like protein
MQLNREALLKFIEWAEDHAERLILGCCVYTIHRGHPQKVGLFNLCLNHRADLLNDHWPIVLGNKSAFHVLN